MRRRIGEAVDAVIKGAAQFVSQQLNAQRLRIVEAERRASEAERRLDALEQRLAKLEGNR